MLTGNAWSVKTIQVTLFNGEPKIFILYWTKFKVFAGVKGFQKALKECAEKNQPSSKDATSLPMNNSSNSIYKPFQLHIICML